MIAESGSLVIHCSDPRYQAAFHDFIRQDLRLDRYALVAVPGGPQLLTALEYLPKFGWSGWRWLKFLRKLGATGRVVLIAHDDCRWYQELPPDMSVPPRERQLRDLRFVCAGVRERLGTNNVEIYYARLEGGRAVFEAIR